MPSNRAGYWKEWYRKNREKRLAYQKQRWPQEAARAKPAMRKWRLENSVKLKTTNRTYRLKKVYGLTLQEYNKKIYDQNGLCAICHRPEFPLNIDHNHKTGVVRELLCNRCNIALGQVREDVTILKSAIAYLEKHEFNGHHNVTKPQTVGVSG